MSASNVRIGVTESEEARALYTQQFSYIPFDKTATPLFFSSSRPEII